MSEQYATDANLRARINLHQRFSTAKEDWHRWLFERVAPPACARILEVGCGPGEFWKRNLERIDPTWRPTLTDLSPGMIDAARDVLGDRAEYAVADVEELPFDDESFEVVMAHHMLYHVSDRPRALAEIRRVLVSGGVFHAGTNGTGHLEELAALYAPGRFALFAEAFGLETGPAQLEPFFGDMRVEHFDGELRVTEVEPVLAYIRSSPAYEGSSLEEAARAVSTVIERDGAFRIAARAGLISCRKP